MIPGLPWAAAFVLGAVVSPPDSVAPAAIFKWLHVPRRVTTILEGESAVNDASALVAYQLAIAAVVTGEFSLGVASKDFIVAALGGIAVGYAVARLTVWMRRYLRNAAVEGVISLLVPYMAYLPAEWMHVSGVLSAVTAGIVVSRRLPLVVSSEVRIRAYANWETLNFLLNGLVFILIGLQLPKVMQGLTDYSLPQLIAYSGTISLTAVAVRMTWVFTLGYMRYFLPARFRPPDPPPTRREVFLIGWTGLRGIVSLAAAMALPTALADGETPFPSRHLIIFITFGVILATLVVQGLTLPLVIRILKLKASDEDEREQRQAHLETAHAALARLEAMAFTHEELSEEIARARVPYQERVLLYGARSVDIAVETQRSRFYRTVADIQREAIHAERRWLVKMRDDGIIGDDVFRKLEKELDLEESQLP
jgi:CPA1 family monovalent cation:H+ antiporter